MLLKKLVVFVLLIVLSHLQKATIQAQNSNAQFATYTDSLWLSKSYVKLHSTLQDMLEVSAEKGATTDHIETLIELHEYEAYYKNNNDKSLEYLITAIDLADNHKINLLRLKARSKLIYFHQSTTQDQELVSDILKEMNAINELE